MSHQNGVSNSKWKEVTNQEADLYRFESVLIPIIPTFIIIIMALLFNKFSSKKQMKNGNDNKIIKKRSEDDNNKETITNNSNLKETKNKNKNNNKGNLLGGIPRYKEDLNKKENKKIFIKKINKKGKSQTEILKSLLKNDFITAFFKGINKYKGFGDKDIKSAFTEILNHKEDKKEKENFFYMNNFDSIKKYKPITEDGLEDNNNILVYYLDDENKEKMNIYNKNDLLNENEIIIINYNSKEIKLLFPKEIYNNNLSDDELLKQIMNSWCIKNIYKIFNINQDLKIGLSKNEKEKIYNIYLVNNYITINQNEQKEKQENNETQSNSVIEKKYIINNVKPKNIINITTQENKINNQTNQNKNQIIIENKNNNESNLNPNIIINENNNTIFNNCQNNQQQININNINNNVNYNQQNYNNNKQSNNTIYNNQNQNYNNNCTINNNSNYNQNQNYNNNYTNNNFSNNNSYNQTNYSNNNFQYNQNQINNNNNNQNQNQNQINNNTNNSANNNQNQNTNNNMSVYIFPLVGLNNVGSTCFMNATLQCLLHISELNSYFLTEYPNDHLVLNSKNASSDTKGNISLAYYNVVNGVYLQNLQYFNNPYMYNSFAPRDFKEILGSYNSQFRFYEANDSKDLILYLLQTFHEELNYFGDKAFPVAMPRPNQENRPETFNYFMTTYNIQNFSIISKLFYGTYENTIKCCNCNRVYFSYQKFEFISFSTYNYRNSVFNIYNGFQDNQNTQYLRGNNQYFCPACQSLQNGETCCKIIQPPSKLIINIDYGKNKIYQVRRLIFDEMIDITRFINFNFGKNIIYQISGVCTHLGSSGPSGHYIAYCRNKQNGLWYNFNDSCVRQVQKDEIYNGSPYLLLYEQI